MKHILFICFILSGMVTLAQDKNFPGITCETLNNKTVNLPEDVKGKRTVVVIAASLKAEKSLREWNTPLYNSLIAEGMGGLMGGRMYNANLCFIGMLKGAAKMASSEVKERARKNTDKKLWDNYMITDKEVKEFIAEAGITNASEPQFFVLDKEGKIIYHTSGQYTDAKLNEITEKLM